MTVVGLGILTCNRPRYLEQVLAGVAEHLSDVLDCVIIHNDGSDREQAPAYWRAYNHVPNAILQYDPTNKGVARSKNILLRSLLNEGCDWLFLLEDDVVPVSPESVTGYIAACEKSGFQHLAFAHHGPANTNGPVSVDGPITCWPNYVGAFSIYSAEALRQVGLHDEGFRNCWEHVELTARLALAGYTDPRPHHAADATGSENWLREIPGSPNNSSIPRGEEHDARIRAGSEYWRTTSPDTYRFVMMEAVA